MSPSSICMRESISPPSPCRDSDNGKRRRQVRDRSRRSSLRGVRARRSRSGRQARATHRVRFRPPSRHRPACGSTSDARRSTLKSARGPAPDAAVSVWRDGRRRPVPPRVRAPVSNRFSTSCSGVARTIPRCRGPAAASDRRIDRQGRKGSLRSGDREYGLRPLNGRRPRKYRRRCHAGADRSWHCRSSPAGIRDDRIDAPPADRVHLVMDRE